ncbi:MAG: type II secretion system protein [Dehalococcoidales bacterium]|nr:type II secretion system protein [Dehalococcoidales bacterium]
MVKTENGFSLIEVIVALAIIGIVGVGLLSAMTTSSRAAIKADQMDTARSLAQSVMEYVKVQKYASAYILPADVFGEDSNEFLDYPGYTVGAVYTDAWKIVPSTPDGRDSLIQTITVTISFNGRQVTSLEDCKTKR